MSKRNFEKALIQNCAATLAGLKVGNLFNFSFNSYEECQKTLNNINRELNVKGVFAELLSYSEDFFLIYVYRRSLLDEVLKKKEIKAFLERMGYDISFGKYSNVEFDTDVNILDILNKLKAHIQCKRAFPHEIGVFLGYPLEDIIGFMENNGKNYLHCGVWKVYCNKQEAIKYFKKIKKCHTIYLNVYASGKAVTDMTVCA